MNARIVTLTMNPAIDVSTASDQVAPEHKVRCRSPQYEPGGGGINVSYAVRRLGGESIALLPAGGAARQRLEILLDDRSVDHRIVDISNWTRENLTVLDESSQQQFRFVMPGPELDDNEQQRCLDAIEEVDVAEDGYFVISGSLPRAVPAGFYKEAAAIARGRGMKVVVDTSGEGLKEAMSDGVFLVKPNMRELGHLAGEEIRGESDQESAAQRLVNEGLCEAVVVSVGAGGALFVTRDRKERVRAPTVPIISKVGAGDSMVAGIVLNLVRGKDLAEAVRFGVAAGSAAVMSPGTQLCRREDAEELFERISID